MSQRMALFNQRGLSNVYAVLPLGGQYWNGTAYENFNPAHMATYINAMSDPDGIGYYTAPFPNAIVTNGVYPFLCFQQTGGSPDFTADSPLGSGNVEIPQGTGAIPPTVTSLIDKLRILSNDTDTANFSSPESSNPQPDGANKRFRLQYRNVVIGSVYATYASNYRTQVGFVVDYQNGIVTFTTAPTVGSALLFDYNYQFYDDTDYNEFIGEASSLLLYPDPTTLPDGLVPSMLRFALSIFFTRRASAYANKYKSTGGLSGQDVDMVTKNYRDLSKDAYAQGEKLRDNFYERAGQRAEPASSIIKTGIDPMTPRF